MGRWKRNAKNEVEKRTNCLCYHGLKANRGERFQQMERLGLRRIKELYKIESIRLVEVEVKKGDWKGRAMFILGANHPSAILHNHGKENDSNLATTICLAITAISFAQRENESKGFAPFLDDAKKHGGKFALKLARRCEILIQRRKAWTGIDVFTSERVFKTPYGCRCGYQRRERRLRLV